MSALAGRRFVASPYYHETDEGDVVAGYGVWDTSLEDWLVPDGYATEEAAEAAALRAEEDPDSAEPATWTHCCPCSACKEETR